MIRMSWQSGRAGLLLFSFAILVTAPAAADARSDKQVWLTAAATVKLADKWRLSEEVVTRFGDRQNGLYELESNTLLGYRLSAITTVWAGYTHNPQYSDGHFTVMEHRVREQVTFDNFASLGSGKLSARLRLEQRWREGVDGTGWRVRPYVKYSFPLKGATAVNLSNETFVNLNTTPFQQSDAINRMRNLVTVSTPIAQSLKGEAGYMNQHGFVDGGPDTSDHVAYFAISVSL